MESLEHFQQSRAVIEDFSLQSLAAIQSDFGRLYYVSSLIDAESGCYQHAGLNALYGEPSVHAGLSHCHEELFSRILETPLREQQLDLGKCLGSAGDQYWEVVESWRETRDFQSMCPGGLPQYLQDLFYSNMNALLAIFSANKPGRRNAR